MAVPCARLQACLPRVSHRVDGNRSVICLSMSQPRIIQGGMGGGVAAWPMARDVSVAGQLGVVSGTALAVVLARRLQLGDPGGELRSALASFPLPQMAQRVLADHFIPGGKAPGTPFKLSPMPTLRSRPSLVDRKSV